MFTLKKDVPQLYQWDSNVKLIVEDDRINQVQFSQRFSRTAVCVKVENRECFIPNEFLQSYYDIFAYACIVDNDGQVCEFSEMFTVFARPKPDNYIYTPTEILTIKRIEDDLNKKFEALAKEIENNMETTVRTIPQELTEEEKFQARKNIGAISSEEDRGAYYVTITEDGNRYISDRTFDDISHAFNNNLFPYAIYYSNIYPLISNANGTFMFGGALDQSFTEIKIMSDDSISINSSNYSSDWEAQEYDDGFIKNRTHGKIVYKCDTEEKVPTSILGARELTDSQETYLQSIGANTESSKELSFVLPGNDVFYDKMSNEYDYDNYEPPNESNTIIQIAIQDSSGIVTATPNFTVSEIKASNILYGWSFNFTDGGFAENYLKCIVMLLKNVPYNGYIRKGIWLPNYTGSPKKGYACKIEYTCIKKLENIYIPDSASTKVFYIDLEGDYPNYTCPVAIADIKAAYEVGKTLECRCKIGKYTATLPLFIPMSADDKWVFSGAGELEALGFPAQTFTVAISGDMVVAEQTYLPTMDNSLPNPYALIITSGSNSVTYDGSMEEIFDIPIETESAIIDALVEADMLRAVTDSDGSILTDETGTILNM